MHVRVGKASLYAPSSGRRLVHFDTLPEAIDCVLQRTNVAERLILLHADTYTLDPIVIAQPVQIVGAAR